MFTESGIVAVPIDILHRQFQQQLKDLDMQKRYMEEKNKQVTTTGSFIPCIFGQLKTYNCTFYQFTCMCPFILLVFNVYIQRFTTMFYLYIFRKWRPKLIGIYCFLEQILCDFDGDVRWNFISWFLFLFVLQHYKEREEEQQREQQKLDEKRQANLKIIKQEEQNLLQLKQVSRQPHKYSIIIML